MNGGRWSTWEEVSLHPYLYDPFSSLGGTENVPKVWPPISVTSCARKGVLFIQLPSHLQKAITVDRSYFSEWGSIYILRFNFIAIKARTFLITWDLQLAAFKVPVLQNLLSRNGTQSVWQSSKKKRIGVKAETRDKSESSPATSIAEKHQRFKSKGEIFYVLDQNPSPCKMASTTWL